MSLPWLTAWFTLSVEMSVFVDGMVFVFFVFFVFGLLSSTTVKTAKPFQLIVKKNGWKGKRKYQIN